MQSINNTTANYYISGSNGAIDGAIKLTNDIRRDIKGENGPSKLERLLIICSNVIRISKNTTLQKRREAIIFNQTIVCTGGVEDTTFEGKAKDSNKKSNPSPRIDFSRTEPLEARTEMIEAKAKDLGHNF